MWGMGVCARMIAPLLSCFALSPFLLFSRSRLAQAVRQSTHHHADTPDANDDALRDGGQEEVCNLDHHAHSRGDGRPEHLAEDTPAHLGAPDDHCMGTFRVHGCVCFGARVFGQKVRRSSCISTEPTKGSKQTKQLSSTLADSVCRSDCPSIMD